jgi:uncharacterized protein YkwD
MAPEAVGSRADPVVPGRFPPPARLAILALLAVTAAESTAAADPPTCPAAAGPAAIVCEINAARAEAGRAPLHARPSLAVGARAHSSDMVERSYFAHESPDGEGPADRAREAGYLRNADDWRVGEILLWSRGAPLTAARAVGMWLDSPSHRRILLSPRYRDVGAGPAPGAPFGDPGSASATTVTVMFGRRA